MRLPPILKLSTRYQTGWNVTTCHTCHAKRHDNLRGNLRKGEVLQLLDTELTTPRRRDDDPTSHSRRTRVQPPNPQTINGNPSLRIREKIFRGEWRCTFILSLLISMCIPTLNTPCMPLEGKLVAHCRLLECTKYHPCKAARQTVSPAFPSAERVSCKCLQQAL